MPTDRATGAGASLPERVRTTCAAVAAQASMVRVDPEAVERLAADLAADLAAADRAADLAADLAAGGVAPDVVPEVPAVWREGDPEARTGLVLGLDAVNFGSGWHPLLHKRPGLSGARTVAAAFTEWWVERWPSPARLIDLIGPTPRHGVATLATALGQPADGAARPLLEAFRASLEELARWMVERFDDSWSALPATAGSSAARLAAELAALPRWDDRSSHPALGAGGDGDDDREVWLYKRAQIAAADLALAGVATFDDLDRLTAMADNLVPHVLRLDGVLVVEPDLIGRIEREELLVPGEQDEVELRAVAVHAVELVVAALGARGTPLDAVEVDRRLWWRGRLPRYKAVPRHRCRTTAY